LYAVKTFGDLLVLCARRINLAHPPGQVFKFTLHGVYVVKNREAFGENRAPTEAQAVLWKVSGADAFGAHDAAVVEGFETG
jgi:hypothetical protein